jgi:hypothetical protein
VKQWKNSHSISNKGVNPSVFNINDYVHCTNKWFNKTRAVGMCRIWIPIPGKTLPQITLNQCYYFYPSTHPTPDNVNHYSVFHLFVYEFRNISSDQQEFSVVKFWNEPGHTRIHKPKHWVKLEPMVSINPFLNNQLLHILWLLTYITSDIKGIFTLCNKSQHVNIP